MKSINFLKVIGICISTGILISLSACTVKTSPIVSLNAPIKDKIPIRVGYYLQPEYCNLRYFKMTLGGSTNLFIGETMCNGIETMLRTAFRDVVKLSSIDADMKSQMIKAVVIPEIIAIDINIPAMTTKDETTLIKMKWTIIDAEKNILWTDTITGEAHKFCMTTYCRRGMMEVAIQDQFQKAFESVLKQEWWESVKKE